MGVIDAPLRFEQLTATPLHILRDDALRQILDWRNHESVRPWMDNTTLITWSEHRSFCSRLAETNDRIYLRVDLNEEPIGVINLVEIDRSTATAELGLYRVPNVSVVNAGYHLMMMIEYLARHIGLRCLTLHVRSGNERALRLYERMGYLEIQRIGDTVMMKRNLE